MIDWINTTYAILLVLAVIYILYTLLYYSFNKNIARENEELAQKLVDGPLQSLLNGSGINNIPQLNLISSNLAVTKANNYGKGPVYIGRSGTTEDCIKTCANSSASVINVNEGEIYTYESNILHSGAHCIIGPRPECNMKTTNALMTVNSITCRSKFPNIIGGPIGNTILACNNKLIHDPQNFLWDYKTNTKFDPWTTDILDEDELLPDGTLRFRCKFLGLDNRENPYTQHPFNRFHPITNYCAGLIYRAHPSVQTVVIDEESFICSCGNEQETRVKHIYPDDLTSQCASVSLTNTVEVKERRMLELPYKCFTIFSLIEDVGSSFPCPNEQFTRKGNQIALAHIPFSTRESALFEHPIYSELSDSGVSVAKEQELNN